MPTMEENVEGQRHFFAADGVVFLLGTDSEEASHWSSTLPPHAASPAGQTSLPATVVNAWLHQIRTSSKDILFPESFADGLYQVPEEAIAEEISEEISAQEMGPEEEAAPHPVYTYSTKRARQEENKLSSEHRNKRVRSVDVDGERPPGPSQHSSPGYAVSPAHSPTSVDPSSHSQFAQSPPQALHGPERAKVAIPRNNPTTSAAQMSPMTGPLSATVTVPPRPKPGRKPVRDVDHADKRRLQNRQAQRNFRDKRSQQLAESKDELAREKAERLKEIGEYQNKLQALADENGSLRAELAVMKQALQKKDGQINSLVRPGARDSAVEVSTNALANNSSDSYSTPPRSDHAEPETDYTTYSKTQDEPTLSNAMEVDGGCGFCTNDSNCVCNPAAIQAPESPEIAVPPQIVTLNLPRNFSAGKKLPKMQPGSCDLCQADPQRAKACRDLANKTTVGPFRPATLYEQPDPSNVTALPPSSSMVSPAEGHITCSSFIDQINERHPQRSNLPPISEILRTAQLHRYPARSGTGYEIEEKEAAQALSSLSRRNTMQSADEMRVD